MIKNPSIKSYNVRKQFNGEEDLRNFFQYGGDKSVNITFSPAETISIYHEDWKVNKEDWSLEIRIKKFEKDNETLRKYKVYNRENKKERVTSPEEILNFYLAQGFKEYFKTYTLKDILKRQQEKLESNKV